MGMLLGEQQVVVERTAHCRYPETAPFGPDESYPEIPFPIQEAEPNPVYRTVRACLERSGLDRERFGTPEWNPLGAYVRPGDIVLLKPNLIKERHPRDPEGWRYVLTHGSFLRAVTDYVAVALQGSGRVIVADAPQTDSSFSRIVEVLDLEELADFYRSEGIAFELVDLRREEWTTRDEVVVGRRELPGDPRGNVHFDLGERSELVGHAGAGHYYGADYDSAAVNAHHCDGRHEYLLGGSVMAADVFINLPKLKTHKKAGVTVALKNLVGINGDKNWLPHHTEGTHRHGGDEHPQPGILHLLERWCAGHLRRLSLRSPSLGTTIHRHARRMGRPLFGQTDTVVRSGNWWGNDTVWRMCLDLNKLLLYGNLDGSLREPGPAGRKRYLAFVDGIVAGQGRGPLNPDPYPAGVVLFGANPASVDAAAAVLMGFDPELIPIVRHAFRCGQHPLAEWDWPAVELLSGVKEWQGLLGDVPAHSTMDFEPHFAWVGHIERRPRAVNDAPR